MIQEILEIIQIEKNVPNSKWRLPSLSELTPIISYIELTHLDSEAFKYQ